MVIDVIIPQPGANQIEIADEAYKRIEQLKKDLPEDVTVEMVYDNTRFIRASIAEVEETIYVAFLLVVLIIFLFLRDWRVTLVPVVVIPVSLVGAFFVMYVSGFSINVLTMLAVVLSVGLVVDDAIVMAENIYVRIEQGMEPKEAGIDGAKEIFFAVVSTTVTLVSVFLTLVQGVQYRDRRFRNDIFLCGFDLYADVGDQAAEKTRKQRLVVHKDGTVLRRHEQYLCKVAERVPEPQVVVHTDCRDPFRLHRLFLANHPLRTFSIGRPFIHFDQYTCTGRSYLRVHPRLYGPSGRHGRHVGSRAASPNGSCE